MPDAEAEVRYDEPVLCYIDRRGKCWAWFTTRQLDKQWGDDWNDAPWEHNAGEPYEFDEDDADNDIEPWELIRVAFDVGDEMVVPGEYQLNSPYCVRDINRGAVAWLAPYYSDHAPILAGTTLSEFKRLIKQYGGEVYVRED